LGDLGIAGEVVNRPGTGAILLGSILGWGVAALLGFAAAWVVRIFGVPNMPAALITIGVAGFVGGGSHGLLLRGADDRISWRQILLLSSVWCLTCMGGVTPLFLMTGTIWKMAVVTLTSFGVFGALGGMVTVPVICSPVRSPRFGHAVSAVLIWTVSLALAAAGSDLLGEGLQRLLSSAIAWPLATTVAVLVIGSGSGFALIRLLKS